MKAAADLWVYVSKKGLKPQPKTSVSVWADSYRIISAGAAEPGRWKTSRAPYQQEIMDAFTTAGVRKVVVMSSSQVGKSDIMNNVIGRFAHLDPCPIMMIQPTIEMAEDFSKSRIAPMIRDTKVLSGIFYDIKNKNAVSKTRDGNNTILSKIFPGGRLVMCGANSPAGLASRPVRVLLADEVDRFPVSAGTEGDPVDLAKKRMTTYWNRVMGLFSTPTTKGSSRIEEEYLSGTQEEWQHRCPNCGEWHLLTHRQMTADHEMKIDRRGEKHVVVFSVRWRCPDCGKEFSENEMRNSEQKYVAQNEEMFSRGVRSFFVNCWASPWTAWADVMQEWLEAGDDPERERVVANTRFGESYERSCPPGVIGACLERREQYGAELPDGVLLLTAAVDVQDNRLEYEICGWGMAEECWGIEKGIILGVPDSPAVWDSLSGILDKTYTFKDGTGLLVAQTFIDSGGHYGQDVYEYCHRRIYRRCFAIKGLSQPGKPLYAKVSKANTKKNWTVPLVLLGVDSGKQHVMDRMSIATRGAKYFHFPLDEPGGRMRGYDEIYFKGLFAEKKVPVRKRGRLVYQWENVAADGRNEPLDLRVYNLACLHSMWGQYERLVAAAADGRKTAAQSKTPGRKSTKKRGGCINKGIV